MIRPIRTAPTPISTQAQAGRPLLFDCSGLVLAVGSTWTVAVLLVTDVVLAGASAVLVSVTVSVLAGRVIVFVSVVVIAPPPELVLDSVVAAVTTAAGPVVATTQASAAPAASATVDLLSTGALRDLTHRRLSPVCAPGATVRARLLMVCGHDALKARLRAGAPRRSPVLHWIFAALPAVICSRTCAPPFTGVRGGVMLGRSRTRVVSSAYSVGWPW